MHMNWIRAAVIAVPLFAGSSAFAQSEEIPTAPAAFQIFSRWTTTATNGGIGTQGTPVTLTWSFVRDGVNIPAGVGEPAAPSNLIANFDSRFGTSASLATRPWFRFFNDSLNRWASISGLTYNYEANDDGAAFPAAGVSNGTAGVLGTRGDIRIAGKPIDGAFSVLAYNYYPNSGDQVLDTQETMLFDNPANDYRSLRNTITHEAGHGLGLNHVASSYPTLMNTSLNNAFDGPQLDEILGAQRNYGDAREKGNGNDNAATSDSLGTFIGAGSASVGTNGATTGVALTDTDFLSIDDETDVDVFSFTLTPGLKVALTLDPKGPTYTQGPVTNPATAGTTFDASAQSDLTLTLLGTDGTTVLGFANALGLGGTETLSQVLLAGGTYYARIAGLTADAIQLYQLDLNVSLAPEPTALAAVALLGVGLRRRRTA